MIEKTDGQLPLPLEPEPAPRLCECWLAGDGFMCDDVARCFREPVEQASAVIQDDPARAKPEWVATVYHDWTCLQIIESGIAFAFHRETGHVCKLPSKDCPIIQLDKLTFGIPS